MSVQAMKVAAWGLRVSGFVLMGWAYVLEPRLGKRVNAWMRRRFEDAQGKIVVLPAQAWLEVITAFIFSFFMVFMVRVPYLKDDPVLAILTTFVVVIAFMIMTAIMTDRLWKKGVAAFAARGFIRFIGRTQNPVGPLGAVGFLFVILSSVIDNPWL